MGQCTSRPAVMLSADGPSTTGTAAGRTTKSRTTKSRSNHRPDHCLKESVTVTTTATSLLFDDINVSSASASTTSSGGSSSKNGSIQDIEDDVESPPLNSNNGDDSNVESSERTEEEEGCFKIMPLGLHPHHLNNNSNASSASTKKKEKSPEDAWLKKFTSTYGGEESSSNNNSVSSCQLSEWSSELEFEESMSSLGDRTLTNESPHQHQEESLLDDKNTPNNHNDDSLSLGYIPVHHVIHHQTHNRRCSHADDPISSWSDLNTSLNPACSSERRVGRGGRKQRTDSMEMMESDVDDHNHSFSDSISTSMTNPSFSTTASGVPQHRSQQTTRGGGLRRDSVTSIGTMNSWGGLNTYGYFGGRRSSTSSKDRLREDHWNNNPPQQERQQQPFGRRYSMTPSVDTVSEDEGYDDWNESNATSLLSMDGDDDDDALLQEMESSLLGAMAA